MFQFLNITDNSVVLFSPSLNEGNGGVYECRAVNEFTESIISATIDVLGKFSNFFPA